MRFPRYAILSFLLAGALSVFAADDLKPVALSEVPAAVQKTIGAQIGDGKLGGIERNSEGSETIFEVSFTTKAGAEQDFTVADDGTELSIEVGLAQTPAAVQKTIEQKAGGWELESINKTLDDTEPSFDVQVVKDGKEKSFSVAEDGELLSAEVGLAETPKEVQATIQTEVADGSLKSIDEIFDEDGNTFDVVAVAKDGSRKSFIVGENGAERSVEISLDEVPKKARKTIKEQIGAGKILRIDKGLGEKKRKKGQRFEVEGRKDGKIFDFSVNGKGKAFGIDQPDPEDAPETPEKAAGSPTPGK